MNFQIFLFAHPGCVKLKQCAYQLARETGNGGKFSQACHDTVTRVHSALMEPTSRGVTGQPPDASAVGLRQTDVSGGPQVEWGTPDAWIRRTE